MRVICDIGETTLENDEGFEIDGVSATCRRCGNITESFGTEGPSVRRCLVMMRNECPLRQSNFYVSEDDE
jgi:hypothetical protein